MGAWELFIDAISLFATAVVLAALRWAAILRAQAHITWPSRRRKATQHVRPRVERSVAPWVVGECR